MKISASIYAASKEADLKDIVQELDDYGIDAFHIDCIDAPEVFDDIAAIRTYSNTPIDLHIISKNPEQYFDRVKDLGIEWLNIQYEPLPKGWKAPKIEGTKIGLSIVSDTPIEVYEPVQTQVDFVLMMTTQPGQSGGSFNQETFQKIRAFQALYPGVPVHVDGGINHEVSFLLRNMGVRAIVSGSFLLKHSNMAKALTALRTQAQPSQFLVQDAMVPRDQLPLLQAPFNLKNVLERIEQGQQGFVLITNEHHQLQGIITNADVRRCLLKHFDTWPNIPTESLLNRQPAKIEGHRTIAFMLNYIRSLRFPVLFLPVIDDDQTLLGAVIFNQLIKGEL